MERFHEDKHYIPQHPLPQEIQDLPIDDTVCKYCGVSYLIHNEIKKLEEKLDEYKNEVERLHGFYEREKLLKEEINNLKSSSEDLLLKWRNSTDEFNRLSEISSEKDKEIESLNLHNASLQKQKVELAKNLNQITAQILTLKFIFQDARKLFVFLLKDQKTLLNDSIQNINSNVKKKVERLELCFKDKDIALNEVKDKLKIVSIEHNKKFTEFQNEKAEEIEKLLCNTEEVKKQLLENQRKLFFEKEERLESYHRKEIEDLNFKIQNLKCEVKTCEDKKILSDSEWKIQLDAFEKEKQKLNSDIDLLKTSQSNDKQALVSQIRAIESQLKSSQEEKEKLILTHQNRIEELREHFKLQLAEAEVSSQKIEVHVKEALQQQNEKHIDEMDSLENNFKKKLTQREEELKHIWETKLHEELNKFNEKEKKLKNILANMQTKLEEQVKQSQHAMQMDKQKQGEEIARLNNVIDLLKKELEVKKLKDIDENHIKKLEDEVVVLNQLLSNQQTETTDKDEKIIHLQDEVRMLRDCVRKECEERYELTESLSQARTELLALQRFSSSNNSSHKSKLPTPPSSTPSSSSINTHGQIRSPNRSLTLTKSLALPPRTSTAKGEQEKWFQNAVSRNAKNKLKISLKNKRT